MIEIGERQELAIERVVLRVCVKPERYATLQWQHDVIPQPRVRDTLLPDLREARIDLRRHLDVSVFRLRMLIRLRLFFRLILFLIG